MRQDFFQDISKFSWRKCNCYCHNFGQITYLGDEACQKQECISIDSCAEMEQRLIDSKKNWRELMITDTHSQSENLPSKHRIASVMAAY